MWWLLITHRWISLWKLPSPKLMSLDHFTFNAWSRLGWKGILLSSVHLYRAIPTPELPSRSAKAFVASASWFNCSLCPINFLSQESLLRPFLNLLPECKSQLGACFPGNSAYNQEVIIGRGGHKEEAYQGLAKNGIFEMKNGKMSRISRKLHNWGPGSVTLF